MDFVKSFSLYRSAWHLKMCWRLACRLSLASPFRVSAIGVPLRASFIMLIFLFSLSILILSAKDFEVASLSFDRIESWMLLYEAPFEFFSSSAASNGSLSNCPYVL